MSTTTTTTLSRVKYSTKWERCEEESKDNIEEFIIHK